MRIFAALLGSSIDSTSSSVLSLGDIVTLGGLTTVGATFGTVLYSILAAKVGKPEY